MCFRLTYLALLLLGIGVGLLLAIFISGWFLKLLLSAILIIMAIWIFKE